ncbi:response regulator transcription factor [Clostridium sediminicola]|uniref:response regulator n=1 Tax=Clostridium sediminicola TaxID=3114879 RepID=UPI0031F218FF
MDKINVVIVDDIPSVTKRIKRILQTDDEIGIIETANNGYEAIVVTSIHKPDVILMDIDMETRTAGIKATQEILAYYPNVKVVMLTVYEEDEMIFNAFQAGVVDYVLKDASPQIIRSAVKDAYLDCSPIRPKIAKKLRNEFKRIKTNEESLHFYINIVATLTFKELETLKLLCKGKSRLEIMEIRFVEESTIKSQIRSILKKFKAENTREVIEIVNRLRILEMLD